MAKSRDEEVEDGYLFNPDDVPKAVKARATKYRKALFEKNKALAAFNTARDSLIECMIENECDACMVELEGKKKIVRLSKEDKLKIEAPKESPEAGE